MVIARGEFVIWVGGLGGGEFLVGGRRVDLGEWSWWSDLGWVLARINLR